MKEPAILVEGVVAAGAANQGEFATLKLALRDHPALSLVIPSALGQRFLLAALNALAAARRDLWRRFGSEQAVIAHLGIDSFRPTSCEVAAAKVEGCDAILLRLLKDGVSALDVLLSPEDAQRIGAELLRPRPPAERRSH